MPSDNEWTKRAVSDIDGPEECDSYSYDELTEQFEATEKQAAIRRGPKGRTRKGAKLVSVTFKIDEVQAAIIKKLCGKRGLAPNYEDQSHFYRDATWTLISSVIQLIKNEELTTLYVAATAEQDAVDVAALLIEQYKFCNTIEEVRNELRFDQQALDMMKERVENYIIHAATEPIKRKLRRIRWEADERHDY